MDHLATTTKPTTPPHIDPRLPRPDGSPATTHALGRAGKAGLVVALALACTWTSSAQEDRKVPVAGSWRTENGDATVEIGLSPSGELEGFLLDVDGYDDKNPDRALRARPLHGLRMLWGFHPKDGSGTEWSGGKIYDPESGKTYSCRIRLERGALEIRGYVGIPLFGRSTTWARAPAGPAEKPVRASSAARP
jgi:uncharacterized protein (DUF2147 family)